ncbi:hypothetical protein BO78DRAFT_41275 [Aspergillus sclerotiicarbonarius CBS 121057]|uniref:Transmembrane protein n=1 Tax=Aspergillus sclerotiicarbonarius (strain CBS 121057 / IBT 28362) TaxID=1448318 RepID=A0A319DSF8_ASPSB|nr:hypothetical protein BO78DRAFT_41275 [Aspergillus sclerotiicarbonarius CBS 121057]
MFGFDVISFHVLVGMGWMFMVELNVMVWWMDGWMDVWIDVMWDVIMAGLGVGVAVIL